LRLKSTVQLILKIHIPQIFTSEQSTPTEIQQLRIN